MGKQDKLLYRFNCLSCGFLIKSLETSDLMELGMNYSINDRIDTEIPDEVLAQFRNMHGYCTATCGYCHTAHEGMFEVQNWVLVEITIVDTIDED